MLEDNLARYRPGRVGFYEVWYLKLNHLQTGTALWVRYTILVPRDRSVAPWGELWAIFFDPVHPGSNLAGRERIQIGRVETGSSPIVRIGEALFGPAVATGRLTVGTVPIEWDLTFEPNRATFHHVPPCLRWLGVLPTEVCTPNVDLRVSGAFEVGGRVFRLAGDPGQQGHIWGTRHGHRWSWAHCNSFDGETGAVFEGLTAQIKVGPFVSPPLTSLFLRLGGVDLTLNSPRIMLFTASEHGLGFWRFSAGSPGRRFVGELSARVEDIVVVEYTDTDLTRLYCHNTKVGSMRLLIQERTGGTFGTVAALESRGRVALEYVDRVPHPSMTAAVR